MSSNFSYLFGFVVTFLLFCRAYRSVIKDYHDYLALGPGGTPYNFGGYLKITYLRLFTLKDPFQPPSLAQACNPITAYLRQLPRRAGTRPRVVGIAPHRQIDQKCSAQLHDKMRSACLDFVTENAGLVEAGSSCFEKHGLALFLTPSTPAIDPDPKKHPAPGHLNATCAGEICHVHSTVCPIKPCTFPMPVYSPILAFNQKQSCFWSTFSSTLQRALETR